MTCDPTLSLAGIFLYFNVWKGIKHAYECVDGVMLKGGCGNPVRQVVRATKFCTVAPNICGFLWNLLHVTPLPPRIVRFLLDIWKICSPLFQGASCQILH
jgi:hypothetical protein